jgi:hypothetical protein
MHVNAENLSSSSSKKNQTQHQPHVNADENLTFLQRFTRRLRNPFGSKQKAASPKAFTDEQAHILPDALPEQPSASITYNFDLIKAEDLAQGPKEQREKLIQIRGRKYLDELERTTPISILPFRKIMYETAIDNISKKTSIKALTKFKKLMKSLISDIYLLQRIANGEKLKYNSSPEKKKYFDITEDNYYLLLPSLTSFEELFQYYGYYDGEGGLTLNNERMEKLISEDPNYLNNCLGLNSKANAFLSDKRKTTEAADHDIYSA